MQTTCGKVPGVADRDCQPLKSLTMEHTNTKYPEDQGTHAFLDSCAAEAALSQGDRRYIGINERDAYITLAIRECFTKSKPLQETAEEIRGPKWSSSPSPFCPEYVHNPQQKMLTSQNQSWWTL